MGYVADAFQGRAPLGRVFWLYGVLPSNLLWAVTLYLIWVGADAAASSLALFLLLIYTAWIVVAVWRCADNVADFRYGVVARSLTVVWAINTVLLVGFLQLEVLAL